MLDRRKSSTKKIPKSEFAIFNAALSVLEYLHDKEHEEYERKLAKLIELCRQRKGERGKKKVAQNDVDNFISKFERKSSKAYGVEGFDPSLIVKYLKDERAQKKYLRGDIKINDGYANQFINMITKIINHFSLLKLAKLFNDHYSSQVYLIDVVKYLDPEHKKNKYNPPETRYPSLLTIMNRKKNESDIPRPSHKIVTTQSEWKLFPKEKMNPRLPLVPQEMGKRTRTPSEIKYKMDEKERYLIAAEIIGTEEVLKEHKKNKRASRTPGPLYLGSFPVVGATNREAEETQTVAELYRDRHIRSVLTIDEKNVAEWVYDYKTKALPSDWLKYDVSVGLIQCRDLHAMRTFHTLLAAQYLFSETLLFLPFIKNSDYANLVKSLMKKRFQEEDEYPQLKTKNKIFSLFDKTVSAFSPNKENYDEINCLNKFMALTPNIAEESELSESSAIQSKNKGRVLVHCKAGMSRSATALLTMYFYFIEVILHWHHDHFIHNEKDQVFFGAIIKAIFHPSKNPLDDVHHIINIFSKNYRLITPLSEQKEDLAKIIQYKKNMLNEMHPDFICAMSLESSQALEVESSRSYSRSGSE